MQLKKLEILHYARGTSDKVYILELTEELGINYVHANYGRRTMTNLTRQLKLAGVDYASALRKFSTLVDKKVHEGYLQLPQGGSLDIPGFAPILAAIRGTRAAARQSHMTAVIITPPECRKLPV